MRTGAAETECEKPAPSTPPAPKCNLFNRAAAVYLTLSMVSGFVELGAIIWAVSHGLSTLQVLIIGLAYQLGAMFKNPLHLPDLYYRGLIVLALVVGASSNLEPQILPFAVLLFSAGLQGLREEALNHCQIGTLPKRAFRILGFVAAGYFRPFALPMVALLVLLMATTFGRRSASADVRERGDFGRSLGAAGVAMIVHQMHYFAYAYALPILLLRLHGLSGSATALAFTLGWVSYSLAPTLLGRLPTLSVVVVGHVAVAATLALMAMGFDDIKLLLVTWFASGFGGGTVFGIKRLAQQWSSIDRTRDLDLWENVGHVLGVIIAIGVILATRLETFLFLAGAALSLIVAIGVAIVGYARRQAGANPRLDSIKAPQRGISPHSRW